MSIATDIEVNWRGTVDETNKIGLSSTLNLLGVNAFNNADYCLGFQNPALKLTKESEGYPKSTEASNNAAFYISNNVGYSLNGFNNPDGAYYRTLLFAVPTNWTWGWDSNLRSNNNTVRIVTKLDLSKNKAYLTTLETTKSDRVTSNNLIYGVNESLPDTGALGILLVGNVEYKILCGNVYLTDNGYYIKFPEYIDPLYDNFNAQYGEGALPNFNYDTNSNMMFSAAPVMFSNAGWTISTSASGPAIYNVSTYNNTEVEVPPSADNSDYKIFGTYSRVGSFYWRVQYQMSVEYWLWLIASFGLLFDWNGTAYKPIIQYGELKGYTNDMTVESDIDNWTDVTGHNISPTPPVPPSPSGDAEPETFGWGGNEVGGMVHYYLLTQSEMESLAGFMSNPNWTIDYRNCIVSMFIIPNNGTVVFDDDTFEPTTVKFRLDENNKVDTGISCNRIHNVVNNHGTIEIPRMNNNFLDYEPYSKYYVYVPFCGVTSLPDYIAGKEITVSIYPDVPTCSCTAVISSEGRKIATLRGNFGSSIPVTSDGSGLKTAAVINSMANGLVGLGEMAAGAGLDNPGLVIGGGMTAISSILQTALTFGQAFGYSVGSSGDTSFFGIGNRCEYYIAYPQWNNPDGEDTNIYGHTYGFVVNKRGIIGDFEGFTVCDNPHVTGFSCTSDEKDEIERLLREGIIIHKPSE